MRSYLFALATNYLSLALGTLIVLFLVPYLLEHVGAELTGVYILLMTASSFVAVGIGWLAGAGVKLIAAAHVEGGNRAASEIHGVVFWGFFVYSVFILGGTFLWSLGCGRWWLVGGGDAAISQGRNACVLLGVFVLVSYVHNADLSLFTGMLRQGTANLYRALAQILFAVSGLLLVTWKPQIDLLLAAQAGSALVTAVIARFHLRFVGILTHSSWRMPTRSRTRELFVSVGGPYFVFGLAQFTLMYADVFITGAVLGAQAVAAFVAVWKIAEFAALFIGRVSEILSPYFTRMEARGDVSKLRGVFLSTSRLQHWLALTAGAGYALFGPCVVSLWVGPEHRPDEYWMYPLAGACLAFQVVNRHDTILHFALARVGRLLIPHFLEVAIKIALSLALFPLLNIAAPLAAFFGVQLLGITWWYRKAGLRLIDTDWASWWREVARPAALVLPVAAAFLFACHGRLMHWSWREALPIAALFLVVIVTLVFWYERRRDITSILALRTALSEN